MEPIFDVLMKRKSVRVYEDRPIPEDAKQFILNAAMRAPTAGNMMLYTIIEVEDQDLKDRLAVTCDNQPFIAKAPYVLLFLADYQRWFDSYITSGVRELCQQRGIEMRLPQEGDLFLACCDALIAAQTAVIAAEALGIGSCYIGDILEQYETHQEMFSLPKYALPITMVCFGYPTPEQAARKQPERFDPKFVVHQNTYHRLSKEELDEMTLPRTAQLSAAGLRKDGLENAGQFNYFKKFNAEFSIEMSRSVQAMIRRWTEQEG